MNTTTLEPLVVFKCLPVQDKIPMLNILVRQILAAIHILIMSIGVPANIAVTYLIYRTEQYQNQSTRLIMYLSITDVFGTCIINGASTLYMLSYEDLTCPPLLIIHSFVNCAISLNYMLILGIAIDRMLKVRYLNDYPSVFTPFRFKLVLGVLCMLAVVQASLIISGIYFLGYGYATILSAPIHLVCAVVMVGCYFLSIKKLREMNTASQRISTSDRSIVKIASLHLAIFVACIMPILVWQMVSNIFLSMILSEVIDILVVFVLFVLISLHSTLNAFMFLVVNRESRRAVVSFIQRIRQNMNMFGNRAVGVQHE